MKDKRILIIAGLVAVLLVAIPLTVYIANQQQDVRSNAQVPLVTVPSDTPVVLPTSTLTPTPTLTSLPTLTPTPTIATGVTPTPTIVGGATATPVPSGACTTPGAVSGVDFNYPSCQGTQCNFAQASCSWAAVNGAVSYTITVTQVESGTVTTTTTVTAPTVTYAFPVQQGQTYQCSITAVNSCGTSGAAGSAQALCTVDGQVSSPAPTTPATAPQVIPTVAATGDTNTTILIGVGGVLITILGGALFFFSGL